MDVEAGETLRDAAARLNDFADVLEHTDPGRTELDEVIADLRLTAFDQFGPRPRSRRGDGGKGKILEYLIANVGEWVHGEELAAISGIDEWARRTRELRTEEGYDIEQDDRSYRLNSANPDTEAADAWRIPNEIRRRSGSSTSRLLALLKAYEGEVVDTKQLAYVAKVSSAARRVRQLRDEEGWPIESHIDDPKLRPGQYRLTSSDPKDRRDTRQRLYPEALRVRVFERDGYTCQICRRNREKAEKAGDSRFYLEVHHLKAVAEELEALPRDQLNDEGNLITYCHDDHLRETAEFQERRRKERKRS